MSDVTERHKRNAMFIQLFARLMVGEMAANATKGDWVGMRPMELMFELSHHKAKLFKAMCDLAYIVDTPYKRDALEFLEAQQFVLEHAADTANICMFIAFTVGNMMGHYDHPTDPPSPDSLSSLVIDAENVLTLVTQMRTRQTTPSTSARMPEIRAVAEQLADDAVAGLLPRLRAHLGALVAKQAVEVHAPPHPANDRDMFYSGGDCVGCNDEGCSCNRDDFTAFNRSEY